MKEYWKFDIEKFLKDSKKWENEKKKLQEEADLILCVNEMNRDTPVQTSTIADTTSNNAIRRENILKRIDEINKMQKVLNNALDTLDDMEKDCIDTFFFSKGYLYVNVDKYCIRWGRSVPSAYNDRRTVVNKLSLIIIKKGSS